MSYKFGRKSSVVVVVRVCVAQYSTLLNEANFCENLVNLYQNNTSSFPIRHLQVLTYNACRYTDSLDSEDGRSCRSGSPRLSSWALLLLCAPGRVMRGFHGRRFSQPRAGGRGDSTPTVTRSPLFYNVMRPKFFKTVEMQMKVNCALLCYYAAYSGYYSPRSENNLSVPSWRVKNPKKKNESRMQIKCLCDLIPCKFFELLSRDIS
jgi:hypothetical protein